MMGRKPPWPSGRCCWVPCWLGRLAQRLSSTTWFCSSTQRCISGFWQPVRREKAAAASSGAATCEERFMEGCAETEYQPHGGAGRIFDLIRGGSDYRGLGEGTDE